jgi:uncharacterized protein (TIGR03435 family)
MMLHTGTNPRDDRVERREINVVVRTTRPKRRRSVTAAFCILTTCLASHQKQDSVPQFDVISIKPVSTGPPFAPECHGDRFTSSVPLDFLIRWERQLSRPLVQGLPDRVSDNLHRYAIEAKASRTLTDPECRAMVRSMLVSQLKMAVHPEQEEMRAYALTVSRKGSKMREVASGSKDHAIVGGELTFFSATDSAPGGVTMDRFATYLSGVPAVGHPVINRTGLPGIYAFKLDFSYRQDDGLPTIWTALEEQLGLKLESIKAPIEVFVVDHIERPTTN